jgi:hypothetical protein
MREFTASRPELRANLLRMVSVDLAVKLLEIATTGRDLTVEALSEHQSTEPERRQISAGAHGTAHQSSK